jgi:hypothetical protein
MQDWIAGSMAVLGTLLVVAGGTVIVLKAMGLGAGEPAPAADPGSPYLPEPTPRGGRFGLALGRLNAADRLIGWGILLLVLGAVAAGAISFNLGAEAGTR